MAVAVAVTGAKKLKTAEKGIRGYGCGSLEYLCNLNRIDDINMKKGLVLGKFMPLHNGHIALINFAAARCDELIVLVCATEDEPISGAIRLNWISQTFAGNSKMNPLLLYYDEAVLPNSSESSEEISKAWAGHLAQQGIRFNVIFASEPYAAYMAKFANCAFEIFDEGRQMVPVSATQIRGNPFKYWDFISAAVRPYYVKKVCLYGTESTGKTTLTQLLALHFDTIGVPEMARDILEHTSECTPLHLQQIADLHARTIKTQIQQANKLLFVDTDVNITKSYSRFLFQQELVVPPWIEEANRFDLYLYLDNDAPFVQDGTRLNQPERDRLNESHKEQLARAGIPYILISGNWEERFAKSVEVIKALFF